MALRAGIVGCGKIAGNHAHALQQVPGVEVVACCDPDLERARAFAARHGIAHAVGSVDELFGLGLDACTVCTPHPVHEQIVVAAAEAGIHVLCEKPIAVDVAAADRMIAAADRAGITFGCCSSVDSGPRPAASRRRSRTAVSACPFSGRCRCSCTARPATTRPTRGAGGGTPTAAAS